MNDPHSAHVSPEPNHYENDEIDLKEYLRILFIHRWLIIGLAVVTTLLTMLVVFSVDPIYESTATILIESEEKNIISSIEEVYGLPGAQDEYLETQNRILQSRNLSEKVIDKLEILQHPEYDPDLQTPGLILRALSAIGSWLPVNSLQEDEVKTDRAIRNHLFEGFKSHLKIAPVRNSLLINISFESTDPKLSADVPNTLADIYIKNELEGRLLLTHEATGSLTEQLDELKQNLERSEKALQVFRDKEKLIDVRGVDSLTARKLDELTGELIEARRNRNVAETAYRQIVALKGKSIEAYETIPAVLKDVGLQNVKKTKSEAQRKVAELKKRYGPKHPKMIAAIDELEAAEKNVRAQILNVVESVKKEYEVARAKESHLSASMNHTKRDMSDINRKESELIALERSVQANQEIYETFLGRYKETSAVGDMQSAHARVVDPAILPSRPIKPKKTLILLITFLLSLIIGTVLAFLIEVLDNTVKDIQDVEQRLHLSVLGVSPKLTTLLNKSVGALCYYADNGQIPFAESIRTIRSGVLLSNLDEKQKVIMVTSSVPGEGKSTMAANLALSLGQMGKVLLIDCDLRRSSIGKVFRLDSQDISLVHFLAGTYTIDQVTHSFEKENIDVIPAEGTPPNPLEMLSSKRFKSELEQLKEKYDHIVIDSAATVAVSDALVLSQLVNQVIYLIKADETPYPLVQEGIKRLKKVNAPIVGVILNQVDMSKKPGRYDQYYGGYYSYEKA